MSYRGWLAGAGALAVVIAGANMHKTKEGADLAEANAKHLSAATVATVKKPASQLELPATGVGRAGTTAFKATAFKATAKARPAVTPLVQVEADPSSKQDALFYSLQAAPSATPGVALVTPATATPASTPISAADPAFTLASLDADRAASTVALVSAPVNATLATPNTDIQLAATPSLFPVNGLIYVDRLVPSVPEPDSHALLLVGLGLLGVAARARRGKHLQQSKGEKNTL